MSEQSVDDLLDEYVKLGQDTSNAAEEGATAAAGDSTEAAADDTTTSAATSESVVEETSDDADSDTKESESETQASSEEESDDSGETITDKADQDEEFASLDDIPTAEELQKFPRTNPEAKAKMVELADMARDYRSKYDDIGGDKGIEVLKPLAKMLTKATSTEDDRREALASILDENEDVGYQMLSDGAMLLLNYADDPKVKKIGDMIARLSFGADTTSLRELGSVIKEHDTTAEHIKDLLKLEAAGMITDADHEAFRSTYGGSELYDKQQERIVALETENAKIKANPQALLQPTVDSSQAVKEFETTLSERIETGVAPIRETGRWTAESVLAKTVNDAIMASLREEPEYKEALKVLQRDGEFRKDNLAMTTALSTLSGKARGRFQQAVRGINADLRAISESSVNAKRKAEVDKAKEVTKAKAVVTTKTNGFVNPLTNPFGREIEDPDELLNQYAKLESDKALAFARSV